MSSGNGGFGGLLERWKDDPAFMAEGIALDLSIALNRKLEQLEMTRKELADRVRVSPGRISQIMAGNINLTLLSICKVAMAVGLRPSLNLSGGEAIATPSFTGAVTYTGVAVFTPALPGIMQVSTLYSATVPVALGSLANIAGRVETAGPSLRSANEGLVIEGQQNPGEAA
jgi:transcriptional regulator with XRE-family HTH domain